MIAQREDGAVDAEDEDDETRRLYPSNWGVPPGTAYSDERAAWVKEQVQRHMKGQEVRKRITGMQARLELLRKRWAPGQEVR